MEDEEECEEGLRSVTAFPHSALILFLDGGFSPEGVDTIHSHGQSEACIWLPALQSQLLHHRPHHVTAALHTGYTLQQMTTEQKQ